MKRFVLILIFVLSASTAWAESKESAFERITRTGTIRCGYYVFPPMTYRDAKTNQLSGFSVDFMNLIAERASLKVEWTEEVSFGNWVPALQAGRFDVICTPMWPDLPQAKVAVFTDPMFYAGRYPAVMESDTRFSSKTTLEDLNNDSVTFVAQEGNITYSEVKTYVPKAKLFALSPDVESSAFYQAITSKKANAVITDANAIFHYNKNNPEARMKLLVTDKPLFIQQFPLVVQRGEEDLLHFINLATHEMQNKGDMDRLLRKWEAEPGKTFLRASAPYKN